MGSPSFVAFQRTKSRAFSLSYLSESIRAPLLMPGMIEVRELAVVRKRGDLEVDRSVAGVGVAVSLERLDRVAHRREVLGVGRPGVLLDRLETERRRVLAERLDEAPRVFAERHARFLGFDNRAVVDVGEVHHLPHRRSRPGTSARGGACRARRRCGSCRCVRAHRPSGRTCTSAPRCRATGRNLLRGGSACCTEASDQEAGWQERHGHAGSGHRTSDDRLPQRASISSSPSASRKSNWISASTPWGATCGRPRSRAAADTTAGSGALLADVFGDAGGKLRRHDAQDSLRRGPSVEAPARLDGSGTYGRFYSEMRPNSRRALLQSASICARSASTSGKARSSRSRCTNDRRTPESYRSRFTSKTCVSTTGRSTSPNVGRRPMLVTDGWTMSSIVSVVAYTPARRHQLVRGREVRRREPMLAAAPAPLRDNAVDEIVMSEERARFVDAPFADEAPDARAADDEVLVADRIDLLGPEPVARAERCAARVKVPARSWPNRKLAPTQTSTTCSHSTRTVRTNVSGSHRESSSGEADDRDALHARAREGLDLLIRRHQERRRLVGPQHARRMRVEGHRRGRAGALPGPPADAVDDLHVSAVQPVEVAEREHRIVPARRRVVGKMGGLQSFQAPGVSGQLAAGVGAPDMTRRSAIHQPHIVTRAS